MASLEADRVVLHARRDRLRRVPTGHSRLSLRRRVRGRARSSKDRARNADRFTRRRGDVGVQLGHEPVGARSMGLHRRRVRPRLRDVLRAPGSRRDPAQPGPARDLRIGNRRSRERAQCCKRQRPRADGRRHEPLRNPGGLRIDRRLPDLIVVVASARARATPRCRFTAARLGRGDSRGHPIRAGATRDPRVDDPRHVRRHLCWRDRNAAGLRRRDSRRRRGGLRPAERVDADRNHGDGGAAARLAAHRETRARAALLGPGLRVGDDSLRPLPLVCAVRRGVRPRRHGRSDQHGSRARSSSSSRRPTHCGAVSTR